MAGRRSNSRGSPAAAPIRNEEGMRAHARDRGPAPQEARVESRHAHEHRRIAEVVERPPRVEARVEAHRRAVQQHAVAGDEEAMPWKAGACAQHILGPNPHARCSTSALPRVAVVIIAPFRRPVVPERIEIGGKIVGCARDGAERSGPARGRVGKGALPWSSRLKTCAMPGAWRAVRATATTRAARSPRAVARRERKCSARPPVGGIQRQVCEAGAQAREIDEERLGMTSRPAPRRDRRAGGPGLPGATHSARRRRAHRRRRRAFRRRE